jgi:glyoxylase-like metal-dependent hydrolase (beta-lactamase superfamily II)
LTGAWNAGVSVFEEEHFVGYIIRPIKVGEFQAAEKSNFCLLKDPGVKIKAPIVMYLITGEEKIILVDTGCPDEAWALQYHHPTIRTDDMRPDNALRALGIDPGDVQMIVNTHLHWDHCSNNDLFPNARIFVQRKEIQFAISPTPNQYVYYESHQIGLTPAWIRTLDRFAVVDGRHEPAPGIELVPMPGHTPGFQGVLVSTDAGRYLIAGDLVGRMENWDPGAYGEPHPSGIHVDLSEYYDSLRKAKNMCDHILPGHDEAVFEKARYPG